jgi:AcrR family transcriptional regulator
MTANALSGGVTEDGPAGMAKSPIATTAPRSRTSPRAPSRGRGLLRFAALVDATETLLADRSPDDVGLYQIAEQAGVPPASVYHFFPTKEAAFLALAQRYLEGFRALHLAPVDAAALHSWQDLMAIDQRRAMDFHNAHPPAMKLFYGGYGGLETRQADIHFVEQTAGWMYRRFDAAFHMPFLREPARKFHISLAILDSIWAISYLRHGRITEDYYAEALDACVAYCRLFLPAETPLRDAHRQSAERHEAVVLTAAEPT